MALLPSKALKRSALYLLTLSTFGYCQPYEFFDKDPMANYSPAKQAEKRVFEKNDLFTSAPPKDLTPGQQLDDKISEQLHAYAALKGLHYTPLKSTDPN